MGVIRIWTFLLLAIVTTYPYPPTRAYDSNSTLLLTMSHPASVFQSDKVGTYVMAGETINGSPVWRHTDTVTKLYVDACK